MEWLNHFNFIIGLLFTLCYLYQYIYMLIALVKRPKKFPETEKRHRYAILIAARNEEAVIGQLCDSIRAQDYPPELIDICVVADNCSDGTKTVALSRGATVYERNDQNRVGKGYALEFLLESLKRDKGNTYYDAFIVIDADNLLDPHYVSEMNKAFSAGHRVITSYRNSKNYGDNWISSGYALWFLREARHLNNVRFLIGNSCMVSGTGFLLHRDILREENGWHWFSLTEDIEFTAELIRRGEKIAYCHDAMLYDEQPVKFGQSWRQRKRWAKGFLQVLHRHGGGLITGIFKKGGFSCFDMLMNLSPAFFLTTVSVFVNLTAALVAATTGQSALFLQILLDFGMTLLSAYLLLFCVGVITLLFEWKKIRASVPRKLWSLFTFPLFIFTYLPISISALFSKTSWKPIEHNVAISIADIGADPKAVKCPKQRARIQHPNVKAGGKER